MMCCRRGRQSIITSQSTCLTPKRRWSEIWIPSTSYPYFRFSIFWSGPLLSSAVRLSVTPVWITLQIQHHTLSISASHVLINSTRFRIIVLLLCRGPPRLANSIGYITSKSSQLQKDSEIIRACPRTKPTQPHSSRQLTPFSEQRYNRENVHGFVRRHLLFWAIRKKTLWNRYVLLFFNSMFHAFCITYHL